MEPAGAVFLLEWKHVLQQTWLSIPVPDRWFSRTTLSQRLLVLPRAAHDICKRRGSRLRITTRSFVEEGNWDLCRCGCPMWLLYLWQLIITEWVSTSTLWCVTARQVVKLNCNYRYKVETSHILHKDVSFVAVSVICLLLNSETS